MKNILYLLSLFVCLSLFGQTTTKDNKVIAYPCSLNHPTGYCDVNEVCNNGVCEQKVKLCSPEYPNGYCENVKEACYNGKCITVASSCSQYNYNGYCNEGKYCDKGICVNNLHVMNCSIEEPKGICETGKICEKGECINIIYRCSLSHPNGACEPGYICKEGYCDDEHIFIVDNDSHQSCSYSNNILNKSIYGNFILFFILILGIIFKRRVK